ncbi:hypothetical protein PVAP13_4KG116615 [Panicum virgatum]|uniref:Uncharacterized protein n=1 Tax=Panicum virgatum TaxID=38727 RepID=A0A8T0TI76_PANVG|nr:hypothetical protein PVAP13_4KG116615 [Panicum virgatum]
MDHPVDPPLLPHLVPHPRPIAPPPPPRGTAVWRRVLHPAARPTGGASARGASASTSPPHRLPANVAASAEKTRRRDSSLRCHSRSPATRIRSPHFSSKA